MRLIEKPKPGEYAAYAEMYIRLLPDDGRVLQHLHESFTAIKKFIYDLPGHKLLYRYAPGKWSIKETLVHIVDDERIYAYRAMCFARNEPQSMIGFDQDLYVLNAEAGNRDLDNIFEEYDAVRQSTIALFNGLPEVSLVRMGKGAGSFSGATVRAMAYHIAGHELHHFNLIKTLYL